MFVLQNVVEFVANPFAVEVAITVPVCRQYSTNQVMIDLVDTAMQKAQLGYSGTEKHVTYFAVNEAEAGALHLFESETQAFQVSRLPLDLQHN
jgi:hypothetical protein